MNPYNFSLLFFSFSAFLIALLVYLKRQDSIAKGYFIFSIFVTGWGIGTAIEISQNVSYEVALFSARFANMSAIFIPISWLYFSLTFTKQKNFLSRRLKYIYFLGIGIACFGFTPWFIPYLKPIWEFVRFSQVGNIYHIFTALFFILVPLGFWQIFKKLKNATEKERFQLKGFIAATFFGFLGGALTFLPAYGIAFPQYGFFLMPIYPFVMAYFMMREQLFDIGELAQAAHREKLAAIGTLATSINHEIRNPLYIIQGLAQSYLANFREGIFLDKETALQKSEESFQKTEEQAARAVDIMKRFSMFAKQDVKQEVLPGKVDLKSVLSDILPLVSHELELDKIELVQNVSQSLPPVQADRRHLEEILFNLIVNACQAIKTYHHERRPLALHSASFASESTSFSGHPESFVCLPERSEGSPIDEAFNGRIEIHAAQQNSHINILVKDNGPGIPADKLNQIFEPFYTTKDEGTGLGLYITRQLVEKNNGKISVKSKVGEGTKFTLAFPIK